MGEAAGPACRSDRRRNLRRRVVHTVRLWSRGRRGRLCQPGSAEVAHRIEDGLALRVGQDAVPFRWVVGDGSIRAGANEGVAYGRPELLVAVHDHARQQEIMLIVEHLAEFPKRYPITLAKLDPRWIDEGAGT